MGFELCIFDLDGTLIDTRRDITSSVNDMLSYFHLDKKGIKEVTGYIGDGIKKLVERCINGQNIEVEKAVSVFISVYSSRLVETTKAYPGIIKALDLLKGRFKAILTNKAYIFTKTITDTLDLTRYFQIIVGGDTLEKKKPFPDGIEYIINQTGIEKDMAIMIGDSKDDILTAKKAGIASVYVTYGFNGKNKLTGLNPDFVIDHPLELLNIC